MIRPWIAQLMTLLATCALQAQFSNQLVLTSADPAPGFSGGETYRVFFTPSINANGQLVVAGFPPPSGTSSAIWTGMPGNLQLVAKTGNPVPGASGLTFANTYFNFAINDNGQVAFFTNQINGASFPNNQAIIMGGPGSLQTIARPPLPAPVGGNYQQLFSLTSFSNAGVLYSAVLTGTPNSAEFAGGGTIPHQAILQIGQPAPGIAGATLNFRQIINWWPGKGARQRVSALASITIPWLPARTFATATPG